MSGICTHCHGSGVHQDSPSLHCMWCHGTGVVPVSDQRDHWLTTRNQLEKAWDKFYDAKQAQRRAKA